MSTEKNAKKPACMLKLKKHIKKPYKFEINK